MSTFIQVSNLLLRVLGPHLSADFFQFASLLTDEQNEMRKKIQQFIKQNLEPCVTNKLYETNNISITHINMNWNNENINSCKFDVHVNNIVRYEIERKYLFIKRILQKICVDHKDSHMVQIRSDEII
jgi:hypothetical protein